MELHVLLPVHGPHHLARALGRRVRALAATAAGRPRAAAFAPSLARVQEAFHDANLAMSIHAIDEGEAALRRACRRLSLDMVLPSIVPHGKGFGIPWVGYLYDFQHRHLPQLFSARECELRDRDFARMLRLARAVIVNSRDVARDIERFHPDCRAEVFALPFSPAPTRDAFDVDVADACRRHGIAGPYFMVCNQFWKHKDHVTAFRAFAAVAKRYPDLSLVCTGATSDYRFPGYFEEVMRQAEGDGVAGRIRVLGLIPKTDQLALLRGTLALIQPTLFEGGPGGGAVYDAVALGVPAIVSDIAVNREISEPAVRFFAAGDAVALEAEMNAVALAGRSRVPAASPDELWQAGARRRAACGQVLVRALLAAQRPGP